MGYFTLIGLTLACAASIVALPQTKKASLLSSDADGGELAGPAVSIRRRWLLLAFAPSSLLLGVTAHLTTDIAAAPLFW